MDIIAFASGPTCNWFWGSHGCSLEPGHSGLHLCGTPDDPCSRHTGTQVQYHYVGGDWSEKVFESTGFCLGDGTPRIQGGNYPPCGDPENCQNRTNPGHRW